MSKQKQDKAGQRARKLDQPQSPKPAEAQKPAHQPDAKAPVAAATPADAFSVRANATANTPSIDFQTIAMAYGDYTRKSFEQTKSFVEKLAGVRSLDQAIEIQTAFAKQAYETFVTDSQKIRELYSGLAQQNLKPFGGTAAKAIPTAR